MSAKKLVAVLALSGMLALSGCGNEPEEHTVFVPDVLGGELICTAIGDKIVECQFYEVRYPEVDNLTESE